MIRANQKTQPAFNKVSSCDFRSMIIYLHERDELYKRNLSLLGNYDEYSCFLSSERCSGFALSHSQNENGAFELVNVFSTVTGSGFYAVQEALSIQQGGLWLSCFSMLRSFYEQFGFELTELQENWKTGEPNVCYMAINFERFTR